MKKRWIIIAAIIFIAICIVFSNKQRLHYMYELHITPAFTQTCLNHICADQTDELLPPHMEVDTY